jgi:glycosyltransferase involved in cell wall biosynthesis
MSFATAPDDSYEDSALSGFVPKVSVVTPFYNTDAFLAACIESVLGQTLREIDYVLVDNASSDDSRRIAEEYASRDSRIRFFHFDEHLPQMANYNRALSLADPRAPYCKVAQADDLLHRRCLEEMTALADSNPDVTLVGAYAVDQDSVTVDGLDYFEVVVDGREVCRRYFFGGRYLFGSPTTHMYRMVDVRRGGQFYREGSPIADADAAMELVLRGKLGFVHQVLSFLRTRPDSITTRREGYNIDALARRVLLERYGRKVLDQQTFEQRQKVLVRRHNRVLGEALLLRRPKQFWELHFSTLADAGLRCSRLQIALGAVVVLFRWTLDLGTSIVSVNRWLKMRWASRSNSLDNG